MSILIFKEGESNFTSNSTESERLNYRDLRKQIIRIKQSKDLEDEVEEVKLTAESSLVEVNEKTLGLNIHSLILGKEP